MPLGIQPNSNVRLKLFHSISLENGADILFIRKGAASTFHAREPPRWPVRGGGCSLHPGLCSDVSPDNSPYTIRFPRRGRDSIGGREIGCRTEKVDCPQIPGLPADLSGGVAPQLQCGVIGGSPGISGCSWQGQGRSGRISLPRPGDGCRRAVAFTARCAPNGNRLGWGVDPLPHLRLGPCGFSNRRK